MESDSSAVWESPDQNLHMGERIEVSEGITEAPDISDIPDVTVKFEAVDKTVAFTSDDIINELASELKGSYESALIWLLEEDNIYLALGTLSATALASFFGYWFLYLRQLQLNCWCCGKSHFIRASETNNWTCSVCDQFNGFTSEGDIDQNAEVEKKGTNRFQERGSTFCTPVKAPAQYGAPQLCPRCSDLPEIKARRLREFVPSSEAFEDEEIAEFERQLERTYRLCMMCQRKIDQYLKNQQAGLKATYQASQSQSNSQSTNDSGYSASRPGSAYVRSRVSQAASTSIWRTPPRSVYNSIANTLLSQKTAQPTVVNEDRSEFDLTLFRRMRFLTILGFLALATFSIFGLTITKYMGCFAFGLYITFTSLVAKKAPRVSILLIFCVILRQFLPMLFTTNFDIPSSVTIALQIFNTLEQMKIILWKIELGIETVLIFYLFRNFANQYDEIISSLLETSDESEPSSQHSTPNGSPRKPPTQIGARYSPEKKGFLDSSFGNMSIDEEDEGITPFDSVSNFGLPDGAGDAMEISFGTPARKRELLNTSFQSDVVSVISTAAKTTVKVASNVWKWLFPLLTIVYLVIFYKIVQKVQNYSPDKNRLTL
ncbi:Oidioi.mRNA.OKI2018_I69.XSR.g16129.t1.cds [Oikopleura dioica]|uniref:Oidioi.mRNA.OKI2018_I69.XSR.g16129.t1.cds n=1 Tax=Oikopleura dioica TaxID=34765 RepID=A0ABN7SJ04_OIKDI|nr:Oidioi.mRNA.OKI2018_I69.XSR.g16129.t1.cds [Oikopleura dioica]